MGDRCAALMKQAMGKAGAGSERPTFTGFARLFVFLGGGLVRRVHRNSQDPF